MYSNRHPAKLSQTYSFYFLFHVRVHPKYFQDEGEEQILAFAEQKEMWILEMLKI